MEVFECKDVLEDADDSDIYFSPDVGNVLFASAYDGWAFDLGSFARIYRVVHQVVHYLLLTSKQKFHHNIHSGVKIFLPSCEN